MASQNPVARWAVAMALAAGVVATRAPLFEPQLFSFDDVNLTYAVDAIDIRKGQPQPPGYPLFVVQMRIARLLQVKRPESVLQVLAVAGSVATVCLLANLARPVIGGRAAVYAGFLLLIHPAFWYAGLTSALRVQLALFSTLIGLLSWRAAQSGGRWTYGLTLALAVGSGVRPEIGVIFLPLWAWGVRRAFWPNLALLGVGGLAWLVPLMTSSGGPEEYWRYTLTYLADQSSVSNGAFGASDRIHQRTLTWLVAWVFCVTPAWLPWLALRGWKESPAPVPWRWLAAWLLLPLLFLGTVHVADPGQTLAVLPPLCLLGGILFRAAEDQLCASPGPAAVCAAVLGLALFPSVALLKDAIPYLRPYGHPRELFLWIPAAGFVAAWATARVSWNRIVPVVLVTPTVLLTAVVFFYPHWYFRGNGELAQVLDDLHSGLSGVTYGQMRETALADHRVIEEIRRLSAGRSEKTMIIWQDGLASWRKLSFYFPQFPIAVLGRRELRPGSPPVIDYWRRSEKITPPRLEPGWLVIWVTRDPEGVRAEGVTASTGELTRGPYRLAW